MKRPLRPFNKRQRDKPKPALQEQKPPSRHNHRCHRLCHNTQIRTDLVDLAVWTQVRTLLEHPKRLIAQYQRRLHDPRQHLYVSICSVRIWSIAVKVSGKAANCVFLL